MESPPTSLQCAECEYSLRGLAVTGRCPECGLPIWQSIDRDRHLLAIEDRAIRKRDLNHRNRAGSTFLSFVGLLGFAMWVGLVISGIEMERDHTFLPYMIVSSLYGALLFGALALYFQSRVHHADSVSRYREVIEGFREGTT